MSHAKPNPPKEGYCNERVVEAGRGAWTHACPYKAKPGTNKCGIHAVKTIDRTSGDPTADPVVSSGIIIHVSLEYPEGTGPVWARYGGQRVQWHRISARADDRDGYYVTAIMGRVLKKDGSLGMDVNERFPSMKVLPAVVQTALAAAVKEARS